MGRMEEDEGREGDSSPVLWDILRGWENHIIQGLVTVWEADDSPDGGRAVNVHGRVGMASASATRMEDWYWPRPLESRFLLDQGGAEPEVVSLGGWDAFTRGRVPRPTNK